MKRPLSDTYSCAMDEAREPTLSPDTVERVEGCPLCEHSDRELERVFGEFAQWLYRVMKADTRKDHEPTSPGAVDNGGSMNTLKERSQINKTKNE
jgi:hypothetical protein